DSSVPSLPVRNVASASAAVTSTIAIATHSRLSAPNAGSSDRTAASRARNFASTYRTAVILGSVCMFLPFSAAAGWLAEEPVEVGEDEQHEEAAGQQRNRKDHGRTARAGPRFHRGQRLRAHRFSSGGQRVQDPGPLLAGHARDLGHVSELGDADLRG